MPKPDQPEPMSRKELAIWALKAIEQAHRALIELYRQREAEGLTQAEIARRLGRHKSLINRRLRGDENLTIFTLSDMARGMNARLELSFEKLEDLPRANDRVDIEPDVATQMPRPLPAGARNAAYRRIELLPA